MPQPKISVIVSCYNKKETIGDCIKSVLDQNYEDYELLVVDDGSTDGSSFVANQFANNHRMKIVETEHNGVASAKNIGFRKCDGEIAFFLDGDCLLEEGSLSELRKSFCSPEIGCVGGEVRALNSEKFLARTIELMQNEVERKWPFGANVAFARQAMEKAEGFDKCLEKGEDAELFLRTQKLGFKYVFNPRICARTVNPDSLWKFFTQRFRWGMGFAQLVERHKEVFTLKIKFCFILTFLTVASVFLPLMHPGAIFLSFAFLGISLLRFAPQATMIAEKSGKKSYYIAVPFLEFLNALAYLLGSGYWKILEIMGRRSRLENFMPERI